MASITTHEESRSRGHFIQTIREDFDRAVAEVESQSNNQSSLWPSIREFILNINYRYIQSNLPITIFEQDIHDLWYMFFQTAQITDADSPEHDRLVSQLIYAKELGTSQRITGPTADTFRLWTDLPYLVGDIREAWEKKSMKLRPTQRHNFVAFTARLLALGVCDSGVSLCALWLLREALETPRPLIQAEVDGDEVSVAELLPATIEWFQQSSPKLLSLAVKNRSFAEVDSQISLPGELARNAGINQAGFTVSRWVFWRKRFKEICRCENAQVAKEARLGFDAMISSGRLMGYNIPGEANYWAKVEKALEEELVRSGNASVSLEDIAVGLDWADD